MKFRTVIISGSKTATGIEVPDEIVAGLGHGKRPPVRVTINGHTYRSTVAVMGGRFMVGVSAENRALAGVSGGDHVDVEIELDTEPREVAVPDDLAPGSSGGAGREALLRRAVVQQAAVVRAVCRRRQDAGDAAAAGHEGDRHASCGAHPLTAAPGGA